MKKPKKLAERTYETHIYMDAQMWKQLEALAVADDRSITATVRVLLKEAMNARGIA